MDPITEEELAVPPYIIPDKPLPQLIFDAICFVEELELIAHQEREADERRGHDILNNRLDDDLRAVTQILKAGASRDECLRAVENLQADFDSILRDRRRKYVVLWKECRASVEKLRALDERLSRDPDEDYPKLKDAIHNVESELHFEQEDNEETLRSEYKAQKHTNTEVLQNQMHSLMYHQSEELKRFILVENNPFTAHLRKRENSRPAVTMRLDGESGDMPLVVASMIFSFCDLESCVKLREVSSFWYNLYQTADLKSKIIERSPWMAPGGELRTWADCALVFVSRLESSNWTEGVQEDEDENEVNRDVPVHTLVCRGFDYKDKMPEDFEALQSHHDDCNRECELMHLDKGVMDLKTLKKVEEEKFEVEGNVVKYKGREITLPPGIVPKTPSFFDHPVRINKHSILVETDSESFVFPIDTPHFEHASRFDKDHHSFEMNNVFVRKHGSAYDNSAKKYTLYDFASKTFIDTSDTPAASYKGLIWKTPYNKSLCPSFVDLATNKEYFRKDRAIVFPELDSLHDLQQCDNNPQFVTARYERGLVLIDLEGSWTYLVNSERVNDTDDDWTESVHVYPGYLGEYFDLRGISSYDVQDFEQMEGDKDGSEDDW